MMEKSTACRVHETALPHYDEIAILAEQICPVDWALRCVRQAQLENCGMSVMCRDGLTQLALLITDMVSGKSESEDLDLVKEICQVTSTTDGCDLAAETAENILYAMNHYADEWDQHCRRKRCTALVCESYYSVYIDPNLCTGCGACMQAAPAGAIAGGAGMIHIVLDDKALKTETFLQICPAAALKKSSGVKPNLPEAPIPVGSFEAAGARRRRQR